MSRIEEILAEGNNRGASDIHLCPENPVMFRIDGELVSMSEEMMKSFEIEEMIKSMLTPEQEEKLERQGELEFAYSIENSYRVRINVFRQRGTYAVALRILSLEIPEPKELGIPEAVIDLTTRKRGLVLITGAVGSGKTTTAASLIENIAKHYKKTIITLEDPIEYLYKHRESMVLQREIGDDSMSYANALRAALRQDTDVILVGELRDLETISLAVEAAETGHLVFSTLPMNSAAAAVDRMIDVFPSHQQQQIRVRLAEVLEGVVAQQLLPKEGGGRVAAYEILLAIPAVQNLIREEKSFQIPSIIQNNEKIGMQTMDDAIYDLFMKSYIDAETAIKFAHDARGMEQKIKLF